VIVAWSVHNVLVKQKMTKRSKNEIMCKQATNKQRPLLKLQLLHWRRHSFYNSWWLGAKCGSIWSWSIAFNFNIPPHPPPLAPITHVCASTPFALASAPLGSLPMKQYRNKVLMISFLFELCVIFFSCRSFWILL